jgi:hypothetical protein
MSLEGEEANHGYEDEVRMLHQHHSIAERMMPFPVCVGRKRGYKRGRGLARFQPHVHPYKDSILGMQCNMRCFTSFEKLHFSSALNGRGGRSIGLAVISS